MSIFFRVLIALGIVLAVSLAVFYILMHPPIGEVGLMAFFLVITMILAVIAGFTAYRLGWIDRSPTLRWTLLGSYVLSSILIFLSVLITARLMFASQHDLQLATVLLFFAGGIAVVLGYFLTSTVMERISQVKQAAQSVAEGNLSTRVKVVGKDEIADLAQTFNQMAAQLQTAAEQKRRAEDLRKDLIAWVSHDLQTPLASIRLIIEALADGMVEDPQTVDRYLKTAQKDIASLSLLIDDLFQMAQLDAGGLSLELGYNSLSDLISDTLEGFSEIAIRRGIEISGHAELGIDPIYMDASRVGRVLTNLVGNAIRHTPTGGKVCVEAKPVSDGVEVKVWDTGEGIAADDLPNIFDRFYRGEKSRNRATGGAGLGLAIARGMVEAHGGKIHVTSERGNGACFWFTLPNRPVKK
jgi:signal transduction histidine kinase